VHVRIPEPLLPLERGEKYEDPLAAALAESRLGAVTGGGQQLGDGNSIVYCGVDVVLTDRGHGLDLLIDVLRRLGAPRGTVIEEFVPEFREHELWSDVHDEGRPTEPSPEELERRREWFEWYLEQQANNSVRSEEGEAGPFRCPCYDCLTLDERGGYEICPVCFWEDDGQDDHDADVVRGGPNAALSLTEGSAAQGRRTAGARLLSLGPHQRTVVRD
jgi:hypothetical protein